MLRLETTRTRLRPLGLPDIEAFLAYRNDPEVARFQSWTTMSREVAERFLRENDALDALRPGAWLQIGIELKASGLLAGDCAFKIADHDARQAVIGVTLARAHQRQGLAAETLDRLLDHLFRDLRLHRVTADADPENHASTRLLERLGMRCEGHLRESLWWKGAYADELLYAILREEWLRAHPVT